MASIFISYASEDREHIRKLAYWLEAKGHAVWWDVGLRGGDRDQEIAQSIPLVLLWTAADGR